MTKTKKISDRLIQILGEDEVKMNADMAEYTSFKAGGCADILASPGDARKLRDVLRFLSEENYPHTVIGNGSNTLVRDGGYRGVIVRIGSAFDYIKNDGSRLICGAGTRMSAVARAALAQSLAGFEFASGIPGSIGGAVFMNAGAYGGEMADILEKVHVVSRDGGREYELTAGELDMGYRHTLLHETGDIVTEAVLSLRPGEYDDIRREITDLTSRRNAKQPVNYPSAGSFFKRPEGYFAGALIQEAGLKGLTVGGAQVSELHAGFIINKDNATASDILRLMEIVQAGVMDTAGVKLEPEVRIIGENL